MKIFFSFRMYAILLSVMVAATGCGRLTDSFVDAVTGATHFAGMEGNSMYHQSDAISLSIGEITVGGEVKEPGNISLRRQIKREVFIREAVPGPEGIPEFTGAYRYRGYSLFDLLHPFEYQKENAEEFPPGTDLYIVISNDEGDSVVYSFAEIFHTSNPHQVIVAIEMAPVEPYRAETDYPAGGSWRVVSSADLFACRQLENPSSIKIRSFGKKEYPIDRDMEPLYSPEADVIAEGVRLTRISNDDTFNKTRNYRTIFYGMGMGYHDQFDFEGPELSTLIEAYIRPYDREWIRNGLLCFAGADGYRAVFSFSQLFNRADQSGAILAVPADPEDGGYFRLFLPDAFYADY